MSVHRCLTVGLLLALVACEGSGIADPNCALCDELRIRTDRADYNPRSLVRFTLTNRTSDSLRYDWCSVVGMGRVSTDRPFDTEYRVQARCGAGAGLADVIANMRVLAPGASSRDSVSLNASYQGDYQVQVWLVDAGGGVVPHNPVVSNLFSVRPGVAP
jgi:hypothetical protein